MLLIHCVAEDAFWLLDGLAGSRGLLRGYITTTANSRRDHAGAGDNGDGKRAGSDLGLDIEVDSAVFIGLLAGSEKQMSKRFKEMGLHRMSPSLCPPGAHPPTAYLHLVGAGEMCRLGHPG